MTRSKIAPNTLGNYLEESTQRLHEAGITTARLDCLVLLEDVLNRDRANLLAHPEIKLSASQLSKLNNFIVQRVAHTPLAYIRGRIMFYGRQFIVNKDVLIPRPESEAIIDLLKTLPLPNISYAADIGTGSGCIGITAKLELPRIVVTLYDISITALCVAQHNAARLKTTVRIRQQDLLGSDFPDQRYDTLLVNLPYVPTRLPVGPALAFEPKSALFAGIDGLDLYGRFWKEVRACPPASRPQYVITESLTEQHASLTKYARTSGYRLNQIVGLVQQFELL
jgi:release factor glutamine methyltransferase